MEVSAVHLLPAPKMEWGENIDKMADNSSYSLMMAKTKTEESTLRQFTVNLHLFDTKGSCVCVCGLPKLFEVFYALQKKTHVGAFNYEIKENCEVKEFLLQSATYNNCHKYYPINRNCKVAL